MDTTNPDKLNEIIQNLDGGFSAFIHRETEKLIFVPNERDLHGIDLDIWDEELKELENNSMDYYEIYKWTSSQAFGMMTEFAERLTTDTRLQGRLLDALNKKRPFREFKFVIEDSGGVRQQWFDFKNSWQQDFVARQLDQLKTQLDEEHDDD